MYLENSTLDCRQNGHKNGGGNKIFKNYKGRKKEEK